jgi:hypothetical protein
MFRKHLALLAKRNLLTKAVERTITMKSISIGAVALGIALGAAAPANADSQDDQFFALLSQEGISAVSGVPNLTYTAHQVCRNLDAGMSADAVVDAMVDYANSVTPGADPGRLARTEARFITVAVEAYCPSNQGKIAFTNPAGWNEPMHRVVLASLIEGANPPGPPQIPAPPPPTAEKLIPTQMVAPPPPAKVKPPIVGPPPGGGGGGGGNGGGTGGVAPPPPMQPGIITLAP